MKKFKKNLRLSPLILVSSTWQQLISVASKVGSAEYIYNIWSKSSD